jgi:hypothetical protein
MSIYQATEQTTNLITVAAGTQVLYPKAGSMVRMDSTMTEKQMLDSGSYAAAVITLTNNLLFFGV